MKYFRAHSMPADIYVGPLQAVQLTALKYYPASGMPADIYAPSGVIIIMESCDHGSLCSARLLVFAP